MAKNKDPKRWTYLFWALLVALAMVLVNWGRCQKMGLEEGEGQGFYRVIRVIDGDTIVVEMEGRQEKVRLIGIDTPEMNPPQKREPLALEATRFTRSLVEGKRVRLEFDLELRDKYGRILAYVYIQDKLVNEELLKAGLARVLIISPNVKYSSRFLRLEEEARRRGIGIWKWQEESLSWLANYGIA